MRSKAPLALIEQAVMILIFALASAVCLQAFLWSDAQSAQSAARDQAVIQAENAAEVLKHAQGDYSLAAQLLGGRWDGQQLWLYCDEQWQPAADGVYLLQAVPQDPAQPGLGRAQITVSHGGTHLFELPAAWQEVTDYG